MKILGHELDFLIEIPKKFDQYKARAKRNKTKFSLSFQQFDWFVKKKCHYCGTKPDKRPHGIDRIDNKRGYTPTNCATSCWTCNRAKSDMNYKDFMKYLSRFKTKK